MHLTPLAMRTRLRRAVTTADRVLGRLVFRLLGLVFGGLTLGALSALHSALASEGLEGAARIGAVAFALVAMLLFGAGTWYCFGRGRRLSGIEP